VSKGQNKQKFVEQCCSILIQVLIPIAFGFYAITLGQDTNWDIQNYHLYNPYAFLNGRLNIDLSPASWASCFNPFLDLVYFEGIRHAAPWVVGFVLGFVQGLNFIVLLYICKHCLGSINVKYTRWAVVLAFLGVLSVGFLSELGTVYWDNVLSLFLLFSLLIVIASMDSIVTGRRCAFFPVALAGIIAGWGAGLKLVLIMYAISLFISFFILSIPHKRKLVFASLFGGGLVLGFMVSGGGWLCYIWHQMGNPIFPYMNNIFHGELAPIAPIHDLRFLPKNLFEKVFYPFVFTVNPSHAGEESCTQISWLIVYLASITFIFSKLVYFFNKKEGAILNPQVKYLFSFFWFSFLLWLNAFGYYRYQITIEILIPLVLFALIFSIFELDSIASAILVTMLAFVTIFNLNGVANWGHSNWSSKVYRIETTWAQKGKIDAVVLIDRPLAWLIPALDLKVPFIQIRPDYPVNKAYYQRAQSILNSSANGKILVIFQPWVVSLDEAGDMLGKYDLYLKKGSCSLEKGYIGTKEIFFMFCPAERISKK